MLARFTDEVFESQVVTRGLGSFGLVRVSKASAFPPHGLLGTPPHGLRLPAPSSPGSDTSSAMQPLGINLALLGFPLPNVRRQ